MSYPDTAWKRAMKVEEVQFWNAQCSGLGRNLTDFQLFCNAPLSRVIGRP
jgi:hypothetical protein